MGNAISAGAPDGKLVVSFQSGPCAASASGKGMARVAPPSPMTLKRRSVHSKSSKLFVRMLPVPTLRFCTFMNAGKPAAIIPSAHVPCPRPERRERAARVDPALRVRMRDLRFEDHEHAAVPDRRV